MHAYICLYNEYKTWQPVVHVYCITQKRIPDVSIDPQQLVIKNLHDAWMILKKNMYMGGGHWCYVAKYSLHTICINVRKSIFWHFCAVYKQCLCERGREGLGHLHFHYVTLPPVVACMTLSIITMCIMCFTLHHRGHGSIIML